VPEKYELDYRYVRMVKRGEDALKSDKEAARRYFKLWMGVLPRKRAKRSNLFIRKIFAFVENAVSRYVEAMFQYTPYFDLESRTQKNIERADNAEKVLQYYLEISELVQKCITWFKQMSVQNIGIVKLGWRKVVRKTKHRLPLDEAIAKVKEFKLPDELKGKHVFVGPDGSVAPDPEDQSAMYLHEGEPTDEYSTVLTQAGYRMVTLDKAPAEVQNQFTVVVDAPKVLYDGLDITPIDFEDAFWDPDAATVEELRYAGHHVGKTIADLEADKKAGVPYKNLDYLKDWAYKNPIPDLARYKRRADVGKSNSGSFLSEFDETHTLFKVTELWHLQEGKLYTFVMTGEQNAYCIREEDWPYWHGELPYHFLPASTVPFEIIGVGIPELMEHLQIEKNEIRNIMMDLKVMAISPPWLYNTDVIDDPSKLQNIEPGKPIPIDSPDRPLDEVLKQITINPAAFQNALLLENAIDRDSEEVTGITKGAQGIPIQRRTTYSEQSMLTNEANFRFKMQIRVIDQVMKRMARQALKLLDQFVDPQLEIRVTGDDRNPAFVTVDRQDLSFDYDIHPASSSVESLANQMSQANNMIQGYGMIRGTQMEQFIRGPAFLREYFRKLGAKDTNRFILTDEEIQQMQAAMQQQQAPTQEANPQGMGEMAGGDPMMDQSQGTGEMGLIQQENDMLMQGQMVPVEPGQDHTLHLQGHDVLRQQILEQLLAWGDSEEDAMNNPVVMALLTHMQEHLMQGGQYGQGAVG
jgi:hypothetical protein